MPARWLWVQPVTQPTSAGPAPADTIELQNGRVIHGKVIGKLPATAPVRITFTGGGSLTLFDAVRKHGGRPANYCEIGGNPSVSKARELTQDGPGGSKKKGSNRRF